MGTISYAMSDNERRRPVSETDNRDDRRCTKQRLMLTPLCVLRNNLESAGLLYRTVVPIPR